MNALEPITGAYRKAGIVGATVYPSAEQGAWGVLRLNKLMAALAEDGIDLGYVAVSSTASTVAIPDGHQEAIEALLAVKLYVDSMGQDAPGWLVVEADDGRSRLQRQAVLLQNTPVSMRHMSGGAGNLNSENILTGQ